MTRPLSLDPLPMPTIHNNGTPKTVLVEQLLNVMNALNAAKYAYALSSPNARDFYPQGETATRNAIVVWEQRKLIIQQLHDELEVLAMKITLGESK